MSDEANDEAPPTYGDPRDKTVRTNEFDGYQPHQDCAQANELAGIRRALERIASCFEDCTWNHRLHIGTDGDS